jgi:hypothetical protein
MRRISLGLIPLLICVSLTASAQVLSPGEIGDDQQRALQEKYFDQLKQFGDEARAHKFPYAFYFSRTLAIDELRQRTMAQSGIRYQQFDNKTVLAVTGNYYASYSSTLLDRPHRVRQTFNDVMLPILRAAVGAFVVVALMSVLTIAATEERQRLGDLLAGTWVVRRAPSAPSGGRAPTANPEVASPPFPPGGRSG